jgi:hypothetical protein
LTFDVVVVFVFAVPPVDPPAQLTPLSSLCNPNNDWEKDGDDDEEKGMLSHIDDDDEDEVGDETISLTKHETGPGKDVTANGTQTGVREVAGRDVVTVITVGTGGAATASGETITAAG